MATNIQAALGVAQLSRIDTFTQTRQKNFAYLYDRLKPYDGKQLYLPKSLPNSVPAWFGFALLLKEGKRNTVVTYLEKNGIQTRYLFAGNITRQPCFVDNSSVVYRIAEPLINTDYITNNLVWVGCYHGLTEDDMEYIGENILRVINDNNKY
jgi:CDP-6-deoxy-D-xylo-4-hexulose-3-dehydrase